MKTTFHRLFAAIVLLSLVTMPLMGTNPTGYSPCSGGCPIYTGETTGNTKPATICSLEWGINLGLARYNKTLNFTNLAVRPHDREGNMMTFRENYARFYPSSPLQQQQIPMRISLPMISWEAFDPSSLYMEADAILQVLRKTDSGGPEYIHQVLTDDAFTLVERLSPAAPAAGSGFRIRVWKRDAVTSMTTTSGGYYVTTGFDAVTPLTEVIFKRATASNNNNLVYIQKLNHSVAGVETLTNVIEQTLTGPWPSAVTSKVYAGENATPSTLPLLKQEDLTFSRTSGSMVWNYTIVREVKEATLAADGTIGSLVLVSKTEEDYDDLSDAVVRPWGGEWGMRRLKSRTEAYSISGQSPQTTTYSYQTSSNHNINGRLYHVDYPDGSWKSITYTGFDSVPVFSEYSTWKDLTSSSYTSAKKTETTVNSDNAVIKEYAGGNLVAQSKMTIAIVTTSGISEIIATWERSDDGGTTYAHVDKTAYYLDTDSTTVNQGRMKWVERSDGTATTYSYAPVSGSTNVVMTERTGAGDRSGITEGTEVATTLILGNIPVAQTTKWFSGSTYFTTESWVTDGYSSGSYAGLDPIGRPLKRVFNGDGEDYDETNYDCCGGIPMKRSRDGSITTQSRDGLKRVYKVEEKADSSATAVITTTEYNGLATTLNRTIGSSTLFLGSSTRSLDGLTITKTAPANKSTNSADRPTTTSVTAHNSGTGDTVTTTDALGGTSITSYYLDGRIKSRRGTVVADEDYDYDVHTYSSTLHGLSKSKKSYSVPYAGGAAYVQSSQKFDMLGRIMEEVSPASGTTTYAYHTTGAGSVGKLASTTDADGVVVSYEYDAQGARTTVSRAVPGASANLETKTVNDVVDTGTVTLHGVTLGVSLHTKETVGSAGGTPIITSESYSEIGGLRSGGSAFGRETLSVTTRPDTSGVRTRTVTAPDGTRTVTTVTHGLTTKVEELKTSGTDVVHSTTYGYDALQRPLSVKDSGHTGTMYYGATSATTANVSESGLPLSITDAAGNTTETGYDLLGRPVLKKLPDNSEINTAYYPTGQIKATWGSQTYHVFYVYDEAGRMVELHTWKTAPTWNTTNIATYSPSGSQVTTWAYNATSGLLSSKTDADSKAVAYTYTDAGRLRLRKWARGGTNPYTTRYDYTNGMLTKVLYFTAGTTDVTTPTAGNDTATPDVTNVYDALGRVSSVTQANQSKLEYSYNSDFSLDTEIISYDLDHNGTYEFAKTLDRTAPSTGRPTGYDLKNGSTTESSVGYTYDANTGRIATIGDGIKTFTYAYLANSNLIETVTGPQHKVTNTWEGSRDVLDVKSNNKLSSGTPLISSIDYTVNEIGQRVKSERSGSTANKTEWVYDSLGQVVESENYTGIKSTPSYAANTAFDRAYSYDAIGNRKESVDGSTEVSETDNYTTNTLNQYTAVPSVGSLVYDADGNATSYPLPVPSSGLSTLAWDGENRMVSAAVTVSGTTTTTTYMYDALGRRIAETNGTASGSARKVFVYDGWNCVAEYKGTLGGTTPTAHVYNTWGLDLSGSMQGAGGVGGLLMQNFQTGALTGYVYPLYDGNGNITEYVDDFATTPAHFEYDPFGRLTASSVGSGLDINQFTYRFSTKPLDAATGTYNYTGRIYDPSTGRWLSRDPIGEIGGLNLYEIADNSCINNYDGLGYVTKKSLDADLSWTTQTRKMITVKHGGALAGSPLFDPFGAHPQMVTVTNQENLPFTVSWACDPDEHTQGTNHQLQNIEVAIKKGVNLSNHYFQFNFPVKLAIIQPKVTYNNHWVFKFKQGNIELNMVNGPIVSYSEVCQRIKVSLEVNIDFGISLGLISGIKAGVNPPADEGFMVIAETEVKVCCQWCTKFTEGAQYIKRLLGL